MHQGRVGRSKRQAETNRAPSTCTGRRSSSTAGAMSTASAPATCLSFVWRERGIWLSNESAGLSARRRSSLRITGQRLLLPEKQQNTLYRRASGLLPNTPALNAGGSFLVQMENCLADSLKKKKKL